VALTLMFGLIFTIRAPSNCCLLSRMLASVIGSSSIAVLILVTWPRISMIVLKLLLGVNVISSGRGYIAVSRLTRR